MEEYLIEDDDYRGRDFSYLKTSDDVYMDLSQQEDDFFSDFFVSSPTSVEKDSGLTPNEKSLQAVQFFKTMGYSDAQSLGIVANLAIESGNFSDDVISGRRRGDGGKAVGLAQWHPDRWNRISKYLSSQGISPYSFQGQLMAVDYELKNNESNALKHLNAAKSHRDATTIFNRKYERSADYSTQRENYADELFKRFSTVGDAGISQTGGYAQYGGYEIKNPYMTEDIVPNEYVSNLETLDMSGYENTLLGQQEKFNSTVNGVKSNKAANFLQKNGDKIVDSAKQVFDIVKQQNSSVAAGVSKGVDFVNQNLGEKQRRNQMQEYYARLSEPEYYYDNLEGLGGTILNY